MGVSKTGLAAGIIALPFFGLLGAAVGVIVGTILDPEPLFGEDKRARLGTIEPNLADEGTPISYVYGRHNQLGAQIIYASNPWPLTPQQQGGKRGEPTTTTWYGDVIYTAAWNRIGRFERITMDADQVYLVNPEPANIYNVNPAGSSQQMEVIFDPAETLLRWQFNFGLGLWQVIAWHMLCRNVRTGGAGGGPKSLPQLARFIVGSEVTIAHYNESRTQVSQNRLLASFIPCKVIDSRVTGSSSINGVQNTRLILDLQQWVDANTSQPVLGNPFFDPGTGPPPNGSPPSTPLPPSANPFGTSYPFPGNSGVLIDPGANEQWVDDLLDEDLVELRVGIQQPGPSPLYQSRVGSARAPALPVVSMFGAPQLKLSRFGDRLPQVTCRINENFVDPESDRDSEYILDVLMRQHGGVPQTLLDLKTHHVPQTFYGLQFAGTQATARVINPLLIGFDLQLEEADGIVKVRDRTDYDIVEVDHDHLDCRPAGSPARPKLDAREVDATELPRRIHVRFIDLDRNLDIGNAHETRDFIGSKTSTVTRQFELLYTMHQNEALGIARRLMHDAHARAKTVRWRLPIWYSMVTETSVLKLTADTSAAGTQYLDEDIYILVTALDEGNDFYIEGQGFWLAVPPGEPPVQALMRRQGAYAEGVQTALTVEDVPAPGDTPPDAVPYPDPNIDIGRPPADVIRRPAPMEFLVLDIPALTDREAREQGVYVAYQQVHHFDSPIGHVYRKLSGGKEWQYMARATQYTTVGFVAGPPLAAGLVGVFDYEGYIDVEIYGQEELSPSLQSKTEEQVREGANICVVGRELLQFTTATLLSDPDATVGSDSGRRFRLSGFVRGLYGTEIEIDRHAEREGFALINPARMDFVPIELSLVGTTQSYTVVANAANPAESRDEPTTLALLSSLPYPVAGFSYVRKGNGDVVFNWQRRTRARHRSLGVTSAPLLEGIEQYDVVVDPASDPGANNRVLNTEETTMTYTAAQQAGDGVTAAELIVTIYQLDAVRGRGRPATFVVPALGAQLQTEDGLDQLITEDGRVLMTED